MGSLLTHHPTAPIHIRAVFHPTSELSLNPAVALFFTWAVQEDLVSVRRKVMVQTQGIDDYGANLSKPEVNEPSPTVRPSHRDRIGTANIRSPKLVVISPS